MWKGIITPEAFQWYKAAIARKKALGEQMVEDAAAFAQALVVRAEDLERREAQRCRPNGGHQIIRDPINADPYWSRIEKLQNQVSALQTQLDAANAPIHNLRNKSPWYDTDATSLISDYSQDAANLSNQIAQLQQGITFWQTVQAIQGVGYDQEYTTVRAAYGANWQEYYRNRVLVGLDQPGSYWNLGEATRNAEPWIQATIITAATLPFGDVLTGSAQPNTGALVATNSERVFAGSFPDVNPTGSTANCVNCAVAADATMGGRAASALPGDGAIMADVQKAFGGTFRRVSGPMKIGSILSQSGNGARGVVLGDSIMIGEPGHAFNAINNNGTIQFFDGQTGLSGLGNFIEFYNFRFLLTSPGFP